MGDGTDITRGVAVKLWGRRVVNLKEVRQAPSCMEEVCEMKWVEQENIKVCDN